MILYTRTTHQELVNKQKVLIPNNFSNYQKKKKTNQIAIYKLIFHTNSLLIYTYEYIKNFFFGFVIQFDSNLSNLTHCHILH